MVGLDLELDRNGRTRRECGNRGQHGNNALIFHGEEYSIFWLERAGDPFCRNNVCVNASSSTEGHREMVSKERFISATGFIREGIILLITLLI